MRRNRFPPSQGITTFVSWNPAATSNGLCARRWNLTTIVSSPIAIVAEALTKGSRQNNLTIF
jgi:hypothetical protein